MLEIIQEAKNDFSWDDYKELLEVSASRSPILREIDHVFADMKKKNKDRNRQIRELTKLIKNFTNIKYVYIGLIEKDFLNVAMIPVYSSDLPSEYNIINVIKRLISRDEPVLMKSKNPGELIDKLYIVIGEDALNFYGNRELTAIILHEIGHVYGHTSNFSHLIMAYTSWINRTNIAKAGIFAPLVLIGKMSPVIPVLLTIILLTVTRSLVFLEHMSEYQADRFASKHGYGDELVLVFNKMREMKNKYAPQKTFTMKLWDHIKDLFSPSTHPTDEKRICNLANTILKDYKDQYPKLKNTLSTIFKDLECNSSMFRRRHT